MSVAIIWEIAVHYVVPCVLCDQQVRPRQHALQCEDCNKWQHRLCNTGISITDYRLMVNEEVDIIFHCVECVRIPQDMEVEAPEVLEAPPSPAPPSPPPLLLGDMCMQWNK
ncbi:Hypothetical predicted protein [Mytilus galloprovincialis]|uniref:PHD-type domain-containing protein n=1 Tax=Mytilus galloprovincialis TaxID=29158 RepID=A0A8B6GUF8_MYTGA|nr:Hypothetical predicted protein [Mytilus galloprovincialis]